MKKYLILLFSLYYYIGFSQCEDANKLDFGGSYMSKTRNYLRFEKKYKDSVYRDDVSYPQDIKKIEKYSDFILLKAENYIIERGGNDFYKKLKIHGFEVNYKDSINADYQDSNFYILSNYNVSYWILYTYKNKNIEYGFGLEFDKNGNMISENKFPKYSENNTFENLSDYCDVLNLVKKDSRFKNKEIDYIELDYLDEVNAFCWLIEEEKEPNSKLGKWEERITNLYYVNANTNKLETVKERKNLSISCGGQLITKSKKQLRKEKRKRRKQT